MKVLLKGFLAGMAISIGGWLYLASRSASVSVVLPAFLFSLGLMSICAFDFHLYTGRICYVFNNRFKRKTFILVIVRIVGLTLHIV